MMRYWNGVNHYGGWGMGGVGGWGSILFTVLFWGLIIALLVAIFSHFEHKDKVRQLTEEEDEDKQDSSRPYVDIVKERYAKGEINKKEFEQLKKDLA